MSGASSKVSRISYPCSYRRHGLDTRRTIGFFFALYFFYTFSLYGQTTAPATMPIGRPAILNLTIPDDATVTIDNQPLTHKSLSFDQIKIGETKRVAIKATFPGGAVEQRLVDLEEGQTIPLVIGPPQPDKAFTVTLQAVDPILALALSPDGRYLAIGLDSNAIVAWDLVSGRPSRTFLKHRGPVQTLAFSHDGKQLLSGSGDNTAMLWDFSTGEVVQTFKGHTDQVMSVAFSPDGQRVLTGSMDKTAIIWNASTGQKLLTIVGHTDQIFGIAFSPDGKTVGTAALDKTAATWDAETGKLQLVLRGHPDCVSCIAFSPDGKTICTGSFDNSAFFWDAKTGKKLAATGKHEIDVYGVTYTPDGRKLITSARDECAIMWDAASGKKIRAFLGHNSDVGGAVVSNDARLLFTCSRDGMIKLWDTATGMELASLVSDASRKSWAVVAPDGLFDASEPGRRMMGFRFATIVGGTLDQFFNERYHPGLLSEIYAGGRPFAAKPLGHTLPPLVKITSPKNRAMATTQRASITIEATEQSAGGISAMRLLNMGVPVAGHFGLSTPADGKPLTIEFKDVPLAPGINQFRTQAANRDGSWYSPSTEVEVNAPKVQRNKGRFYILAVGIGEYAAQDAKAFAELLQFRAGRLFDRVDVVTLLDRDATKGQIEYALSDLTALSQPQDGILVVLSGRGKLSADELYFEPSDVPPSDNGLSVTQLGATLATGAALKRALVIDLSAPDVPAAADSSFSLNRALENIGREDGIFAVVSIGSKPPTGKPKAAAIHNLISALTNVAGNQSLRSTDPSGSIDLMEWFRFAADQTGGESTTQAKAFPILSGEKP